MTCTPNDICKRALGNWGSLLYFQLTPNIEIQRQLAEYDRKHAIEIDAMILWVLHQQLGWGEKRLRRFYDNFASEVDALVQRYQMDEEDKVWLCTQKLKDCGIDVEQWDKERGD